MGNSCVSRNKDNPTLVFLDENEKRILMEKFEKLLVKQQERKGKKILSSESITELFPENSCLGDKIYDFMRFQSKNAPVNFEGFVQSVDYMTKDNKDSLTYRGFDRVDILAIITLEKYNIRTKEELKKSRVSYVECLEFLKDILKIINYDKVSPNLDDLAVKTFADSIINSESGVTTLWNMIISIKQQLLYLNECLTIYFTSKFLHSQLSIKLPIMESQSNILNDELLAFFYLGNSFLQQSKRLKLLYSNGMHGFNFMAIVNALIGYEGPTLILIKHEEKTIVEGKVKETMKYAFGAFSRIMWKNDAVFHGNEDSYLFSLYPKFKNYYALRNQHCEKNYQYLWYNEHGKNVAKVGLGFGGFSKKSFRIWIDGEDIENGSYTTPNDKTYEPGYLLDPKINILKICDLEIWGLGSEAIYNTQLLLRSTGYLGNLDSGNINKTTAFKEFNSVRDTGMTKEQIMLASLNTGAKFRYTSIYKG